MKGNFYLWVKGCESRRWSRTRRTGLRIGRFRIHQENGEWAVTHACGFRIWYSNSLAIARRAVRKLEKLDGWERLDGANLKRVLRLQRTRPEWFSALERECLAVVQEVER